MFLSLGSCPKCEARVAFKLQFLLIVVVIFVGYA